MPATTDLLIGAPPDVPTNTTPPVPTDALPRTERHDRIFVGYPRRGAVKRNTPCNAVYADHAHELPATVSAYMTRCSAGHQYPYIFVAPSLAPAFLDQATAALVSRERAEPLTMGENDEPVSWDLIWDVGVDMRGLDTYEAEVSDAWIEANHATYAATCKAKIEAGLSGVEALSAAQRRTLMTWIEGHERGWRNEYGLPRHSVTVGEIVTRVHREDVQRTLYPAEQLADSGWTIVVVEHDRADRERKGYPYISLAGGQALRTEREYQRLLDAHVLSVADEQFYDLISDYHESHSDGCDALPSRKWLARRLKERGLENPTPPRAPLQLRSAAQMLASQSTHEPPRAVLPYLAWPGSLSLFAAREKAGKSTLVGSAVAAVTRGVPWLGQATTPTTVLWLSEESDRDFTARLQRFGADATRVYHMRLPLDDQDRDLAAAIAEVEPGLVVIDSLFRLAGGVITNPTDASQWAKVLTPIATLAHATGGPAVIVLHHAEKRSGEYRDSTEIGAVADMLIQMPKGIERGNRQRLEAKGRIHGIEPYSITVQFTGTGHQLIAGFGIGSQGQRTEITEKDRNVLSALTGTLSYGDWCSASGLKSRSTFDRTVKRLVAAGAVKQTEGGKYRPTGG